MSGKLAVNGGPRAVNPEDISPNFLKWPIFTMEDKRALLDVMENNQMSQTGITQQFEQEYADWIGAEFALGYCNGTASLHAAMWACGVGAGDEVICPSITYWASCTAALSLGATVNFADIDPETLCIDPNDIEHRIGPATRAIIVVHYAGHPCDMDKIMAIAGKHGVKVIEDASHSHGSLYHGKQTGTLGDIACMSMMAGKAFAIGEAGLMTTNNRELYERCISYGHYERTGLATNIGKAQCCITDPELIKYAGIAMGGRKDRMNQWCSAVGRVQLKYYPERIAEIDRAMNYLSDALDRLPGLKSHRPPANSGCTKGGWYFPLCHYDPETLRVPVDKFCAAVVAEGVNSLPGANRPLHLHPLFHEADLFHMGRPTVLSFGQRDVRQGPGSLPVSEAIQHCVFRLPRIIKFDQKAIDCYINAYTKVIENLDEVI